MGKHRYDVKKDVPDGRDFRFKASALVIDKAVPLPASVDLRNLCSPVFNQGQLGSCTSNALAGILEYLENYDLQRGLPGTPPEEFSVLVELSAWQKFIAKLRKFFLHKDTPPTYTRKFTPFSRLFIYYNGRVLEGTEGKDVGETTRDAVKVVHQQGACSEYRWPYAPENVFVRPSANVYLEAESHKIAGYYSLTNIDDMKQSLVKGLPFLFGFTVYESFEGQEVARTGIVPLPKPGEKRFGNHAVMCAGYDDARQAFIIRNSWGVGWGDKGYCYMPYSFVTDPAICWDFWTVNKSA